jgi:hypothetical protein
LSDAEAPTVTTPDSCAPLPGSVITTCGRLVSGAVAVVKVNTLAAATCSENALLATVTSLPRWRLAEAVV